LSGAGLTIQARRQSRRQSRLKVSLSFFPNFPALYSKYLLRTTLAEFYSTKYSTSYKASMATATPTAAPTPDTRASFKLVRTCVPAALLFLNTRQLEKPSTTPGKHMHESVTALLQPTRPYWSVQRGAWSVQLQELARSNANKYLRFITASYIPSPLPNIPKGIFPILSRRCRHTTYPVVKCGATDAV
jgi:hypothetical protein